MLIDKTKIREIINRHDPMGLLKIGAPNDEYEIEIGDIHERLLRSMGFKDQVSNIVFCVFAARFGLRIIRDSQNDIWNKIAEDILNTDNNRFE